MDSNYPSLIHIFDACGLSFPRIHPSVPMCTSALYRKPQPPNKSPKAHIHAPTSQPLRTGCSLNVSKPFVFPKTGRIPDSGTNLDIEAGNDLLNGDLDFLAVDSVGDLIHAEDELRDVARAQAVTDSGFDPRDQGVVEVGLVALRHDDEEEDRLILVVFPPPSHAQRVCEDDVERGTLHDVVDLRRPEPDPAWVQHAVRSA